MLKFTSAIIPITLAVGTVIAPLAGRAAPVANAGTLTCTLAPTEATPKSPSTTAFVSCRFNAISGSGFSLDGRIMRFSAVSDRRAKVVVSWSVMAPTADIAPEVLSGRYTGLLSGDEPAPAHARSAKGTLFRNGNEGIELRLLREPGNDDLPSAGLTVLELELASVKV